MSKKLPVENFFAFMLVEYSDGFYGRVKIRGEDIEKIEEI